jgi:hypothetical protein
MVEVDPIVIGAVVTAAAMVIGTTIVMCGKPAQESAAPAQPTKAPKKKSKSASKSKAAGVAAAVAAPAGKVNSKAAAAPVEEMSVKFQDSEEAEKEEMVFVSTETLKKSKKAKETQEQRASRLERQKTAKVVTKSEEAASAAVLAPRPVESYDMFVAETAPVSEDGWAVVENSRKAKKAEEEVVEVPKVVKKVVEVAVVVEEPREPGMPAAPVAPAEPVVETVTTPLSVEARKLGLLIGPKGVTKIGLQTATGTQIEMPKVERDVGGSVELLVSGSAEGVARCVFALTELCTKGYCNLLAGADFHEGYVSVPPRYLPDIIGKGGACIKAIQQHTGIKISTPSGYTRSTPSGEQVAPAKVKINLAGNREKVAIARNLILDLTKYYHTPVTHPGITHKEMEIASNYFNFIIGSKGSEIKHIQANYKVSVYIPNVESINRNLLIVGEQDNVDKAEAHITKIIEKVEVQLAERAKAQAEGIALGESAKAKYAAQTNGAAPAVNPNLPMTSGMLKVDSRPPKMDKEEPQEEWMSEFAPRKAPINIGAMLPATAKFSAAPPLPEPEVEEEATAETPDAAETPDSETATPEPASTDAPNAPWGGLAKTW